MADEEVKFEESSSKSRAQGLSSKKGTIMTKILNQLTKKERKGSLEHKKPGKRKWMESVRQEGSELEDEGVADLKGNRKKREKKMKNRVTDPFGIPLNKINLDLFKIRNPFIRVGTSDELSCFEEDKVMDGKRMKHEALLAAMAAMVPASIDCARSFPQPSSESGGQPIHLSIASGFKKITRPRSISKQTRSEVMKEMLQSFEASTPVSSAMEEEDLMINIEQEAVDLIGHESVVSLDVQHEGDEGEMKTNETKFDICFMVYDKLIMGLDKKVTKLIVDSKWEEVSIEAICQVAMYGLKDAKNNMEKGRYSPIYLEVWGERLWRYAILFPEGTVLVEDGKVKASLVSGCRRSNFEGLQRTFLRKQAQMQNEYQHAVYPDGNYVMGLLFISMKKFTLPDFMGSGCGNNADTKLFYQSKIRIIVGDRVLEWSKADVEDILARREEQLRKLTADFFGGF